MIPRALVVNGFGLNCDEETAWAFELAGASADRVHLNDLIDGSVQLQEYDIFAIPGGFSYGDALYAGSAFANKIRHSRVGDDITSHLEQGKLLIGICNGAQIGYLLGLVHTPGETAVPEFALAANDSFRYEDRGIITLRTSGRETPWLTDISLLHNIPVAHGEGKFLAPQETLGRFESHGLAVLRYVNPDGMRPDGTYPVNPNGSMHDIAGVTDLSGQVLLLMPHPERHVDFYQRAGWTRIKSQQRRVCMPDPEPDGLKIFENAVRYCT